MTHDNKHITISAFFPAYNDQVTIQPMVLEIDYILKQVSDDYEIIVVNDCSTDNTGEILDELRKHLPKLRVIHHKKNLGYGGALRSGFKAAKMDWIFYTDGDGQYDVKEIYSLLKHADTKDFITGYKIIRSDSLVRIFIGKVYHFINKTIFGLKVRDVDCDFRLFRRSIMDDINFVTDSGFFPVEMIRRFQDKKIKFCEVPVRHYYRKSGNSQFFSLKNVLRVVKSLKSFWNELKCQKKKP